MTDTKSDCQQGSAPAATPEIKTELTAIGEQYVIPGAERQLPRKPGTQLNLW